MLTGITYNDDFSQSNVAREKKMCNMIVTKITCATFDSATQIFTWVQKLEVLDDEYSQNCLVLHGYRRIYRAAPSEKPFHFPYHDVHEAT